MNPHAASLPPQTPIRERLAAAAPAARPRALVEFLVHELRQALDLDASEELHARSRFTDLGVDSKRALEFKEFLEEELQIALQTTLIFDYPTPEGLASYILRELFPAADAPEAPEASDQPNDDGEGLDVDELLRRKLEKYGA